MSNDPETKFIEQDELRQKLRKREKVVVIDVRSPADYKSGHVDSAVNIPIDELGSRAREIPKGAEIVTVCNAGGSRCRRAAAQLNELGYDAHPLRGGTKGWLGW